MTLLSKTLIFKLASLVIFIAITSPLKALKASDGAKAHSNIERLEKSLEQAPDNIKVREALAEIHYQAEHSQKVIDLLNPYTEQASPKALLSLAGAFNQKKDHKNEVRILRFILDSDPNNYKTHFILAHAHLNNEDEEAAIDEFRQAIRLNEKFMPAYEAILNIFIKTDNRYEARIIINDMLNHFNNRPTLLNDLCRLYALDGFLSQAENACMKAIKRSPDFPDNFVYLGQTYKYADQDEKAARVLVAAAKRFPQSELSQYAAGQYYFEQKNYPVSERYFSRAVKIDKKQTRSQLGLAKAAFENEHWQVSYDSFVKACKQDSTTNSEFLSAGAKLRQKGNRSWSQKFLSSAYSCR